VLVEVGDPVCDEVEIFNEVVFDKDIEELIDVVTECRVDEETELFNEVEDVDLEVLPAFVVDDLDDVFDEERVMVTRQEQAELIRDGRFAHCEEYGPNVVVAVSVVARKVEQNDIAVELPC
jgi:hypothetical protein